MSEKCDVVAVGNAIVDLVARCEESFLTRLGCPKGQMLLVDSPASIAAIYKQLGCVEEIAGGSCANTAAGIASLGGNVAFLGRVGSDNYGRIFEHDLSSIGVKCAISVTDAGKGTSRSLILVTPDGQRSMLTFLGDAEREPSVSDCGIIEDANSIVCEGYMFATPRLANFIHSLSARITLQKTRLVLLLPDINTINRNRNEIMRFINARDVLVIGNEKELMALFQCKSQHEAIMRISRYCSNAAITCSERGSIVVSKGAFVEVPVDRVPAVVDKTGAGDLYAAGLLFGLARGIPVAQSARIGAFAAAEIICQFGARPSQNLGRIARMKGLIPR